ncbi:MAG: hypothetical protein QXG65_03010 [Thermoplasmata archaeon]
MAIVLAVAVVVVVGGLFALGIVKIGGGGSSPPTKKYTVTFAESGLPSGTGRTVTLNGGSQSTISFAEPNGTYAFAVTAVTGYSASPSSGTILVNGANVTEAIVSAKETTYSVAFHERGLPPGTPWSVTFNARSENGTGSTLTFPAIPNGSYSYAIGGVSG